ncbi:hypothetical protein H4R18_003531 [Coemansia javaensis]|uniref:Uncharacterized protein n=1 Tax=Coemansia javaensis TaxID=2761396 RepID=A0A9W8HA40_9FUNG|nr:hypothetical protein H4R18_003531 [Coemansia javaensis]
MQMIIVYHKATLLSGFGAAVRLMRAAAEEWERVKKLEITIVPYDHMPARNVNVDDRRDEIKQTSAALAAIMPGVCRVSFNGCFASPIVWELGGQLAVLYSDQLESLYSEHPIAVPPGHTFGQLRSLSARYKSGIDYRHPRVDPAKLVSLDLEWWPSNHSWAPFSAGDGSGAIEFPNLKRLRANCWFPDEVDGAVVQHPDGHPWKLRLPRLSTLEVSCEQDACPLLEYAVLPPRMDEIVIEATTPVLVQVAEMRLPTARRLDIVIKYEIGSSLATLDAASRILENARGCKEARLVVEDYLLPVLPEFATFTSLTELSILAETTVATMLELMQVLPGLAKLRVWSLTMDYILEDISVPEPDTGCLAEPFNTRIREIQIGTSPYESAPEMIVPVAKFLLLRIPTLARLHSIYIPRRPIEEFVDAYSKHYPHLLGINYSLSNRDLYCASAEAAGHSS